MSRVRTSEHWRRRLTELTAEYRRADARARLLIFHAVRALGELRKAAEAPVKEAPRYYRESRPLPFEPSLIVAGFLDGLRMQGIQIDIHSIRTMRGENDDTKTECT